MDTDSLFYSYSQMVRDILNEEERVRSYSKPHPKVLKDKDVIVTNVEEETKDGLLQDQGEKAEFKQ